MLTSRRTFLRTSSAVTAALVAHAGAPLKLWGAPWAADGAGTDALLNSPVDTVPRSGDPVLHDLTMRAIDAAKSAGAQYADVRLVVTRTRTFSYGSPPVDKEHITAGVRALVNGVWGFTSSPLWTLDEMARLGQDAASQAVANHWTGVPPVELCQLPAPARGTWHAPVARDPFTIPIDETLDFIRALMAYVSTARDGASANGIIEFQRQERTFASTDGAFCTQTVYNSLGNQSFFAIGLRDTTSMSRYGVRYIPEISPNGAGYESLSEAGIIDRIPEYLSAARSMFDMQPVNPSRYDVVFDGHAMAAIASATIGSALELDRALGLEANAGGTSYLAPIEEILGKSVSAPFLNIMADRSLAGGAATVKWDDEGVEPKTFPLIQQGTLVGYATNREHATTIADWYRSHHMSTESRGCAASGSAMHFPLVYTPNLHIEPSRETATLDDLIRSVDDGILIKGGGCMPDHQLASGQGIGELVYRIRKGRIAETLMMGTGYLFRSAELWKNIIALGDESTVVQRGFTLKKGEPEQSAVHSVRAPAALVRNVSVLDIFQRIRATADSLQRIRL